MERNLLNAVVFSIFLFTTSFAHAACKGLLDLDKVDSIRVELAKATRRYTHESKSLFNKQQVSLGSSANIINAADSAGGHVLYLGSGVDVFRALHNFPLANHFHLVDPSLTFTENIHGEIQHRLGFLGPEAQVDVVEFGYAMRVHPLHQDKFKNRSSLMDEEYAQISIPPRVSSQHPMVIRASWYSETFDRRLSKYIYLYPFAFTKQDEGPFQDLHVSLNSFLLSIRTSQPLSGLMINSRSGIKSEELLQTINSLDQTAVAILEMPSLLSKNLDELQEAPLLQRQGFTGQLTSVYGMGPEPSIKVNPAVFLREF